MAQPNKNIIYTSSDLLRYAQGKMDPQQMHALEKAALEDGFLAEALDGYMESQANIGSAAVTAKLAALKAKTGGNEQEKKEPKIIPLWRQKWLQYAVAASVLLAGGWWLLSLNNTTESVQKNTTVIAKNEETAAPLTDETIVSGNTADSVNQNIKPLPNEVQKPLKDKSAATANAAKQKPEAAPGLAKKEANVTAATPIEAPKADDDMYKKTTQANDFAAAKNAAAQPVFKDNTNAQTATARNGNVTNNSIMESNANNAVNMRRYTFNGKVVDGNNNPLPYSNVMIPGEEVGTYSDARGNFNFVYVDSTLPVRARSLGHEDKSFTMQADVKENRIVLQEDEELKRKMVVNRQEKQASNKLYKPTIVEKDSLISAEPSVGWYDYNIYALNNSRAVDVPGKRSVQLSFDVNKKGEIENITVEKSSGKELDDEAIRLLKEGPKWKARNGKKGRAKVTLKL